MRCFQGMILALLFACAPKTPAPVSSVATAVIAVPEVLPDADILLARALEVAGGAAALEKIQTLRTTGHITMSAQGIVAPITVLQQVPGYVYTRLELPGIGVMEEGIIDGVAWASDPISGPRIKGGLEAVQGLRLADLHLDAHLADVYPTRVTIGQSQAGAYAVWEVKLVPTEGPEEVALIDRHSGRRVGMRMTAVSVMGPVPMARLYTEFREVGGVSFPVRIEQSQGPITTVMQIDEIEVDASDFAPIPLPAEIQALIAPSATP